MNPQAQTKKLAQKLKQETQLTKQEIRNGVQQTKQKYHPLIQTNKAALIIYARENTDIQLLDTKPPELDIENIVPEMNQGQINATIKNIDKFTYRKDGEQRKGCEILLKDSTGTISMMAWQDDVDDIQENWQGETVVVDGFRSSKYQGEVQITYGKNTEVTLQDQP